MIILIDFCFLPYIIIYIIRILILITQKDRRVLQNIQSFIMVYLCIQVSTLSSFNTEQLIK